MVCQTNKHWFLSLIFCWTAQSLKLTILHTNDVHARFTPFNNDLKDCSTSDIEANECFGGAAKRMTAVRRIREEEENVLLFDAGDQYQGTLWYVLFRHQAVVEVMNAIGYDAMALGNHEFDHALAGLLPLLREAKFPIMAANLVSDNEKVKTLVKPLSKAHEVEFEDEIQVLTKIAAQLKEEGVNMIIAVGHSGIQMDRLICQKIPNIDIVVGGHTNTFLYSGKPPSVEEIQGPYPEIYNDQGKPCLVVTDYAFGKYLGFLKVEYDKELDRVTKWDGNPILLDNRFHASREMENILATYKHQLHEFTSTVIGSTAVKIDGRFSTCRLQECNLGNMLTDHLVRKVMKESDIRLTENADSWAPAPIALINSGGIRNYLKSYSGNVTLEDAYSIMPFGTQYILLEVTGPQLMDVFENSVSQYWPDGPWGRFLQMSGARVAYNLSMPVGSRVHSLQLRCADCPIPIYKNWDPEESYRLLISTFMANGGDDFSVFPNVPNHKLLNFTDTELVIDFFRTSSPVWTGLTNFKMIYRAGIYLLLSFTLSWTVDSLKLTLIHTNDIHSRFTPINNELKDCTAADIAANKCFGGAAKRMTAVRRIRKKYKNVLFLDAGDQYQGTLWYVLFRHKAIADVMNALRYDAMALGNHEFDHALAGLLPLLREAKFPIMAANVASDNEELQALLKPYTIFTFDDVKVGVIGYVTPLTKKLSKAHEVEFEDEIQVLTRIAAQLKEEGVNMIIAVGHSGIQMDRLICQKIPNIDIVVGGHTNTFLYSGKPPSVEEIQGPYPEIYNDQGKPCLVVTDYAFGKYLGFLKVEYDKELDRVTKWRGNPILLDNRFHASREMENILATYKHQLHEFTSTVIGSTAVKIDGRFSTCRLQECNLGNMLTDHLVRKVMKESDVRLGENGDSWAPAPIALLNSGAIRNYMIHTAGNVTLEDAYSIMPFGTQFKLLEVTGRQLMDVFENSVSQYWPDGPWGRFLQMSGARVAYNLSMPVGSRVHSLQLRCGDCPIPIYKNWDAEESYRLIISTFMAKGGDDFSVFPKVPNHKLLNFTDTELVIDFFRTSSPVWAGIENRITFV
ncbi:Snake venom 5'-nucleotidase [Trichinella murrelli]|uniref:Snake venom 5'-nucleotidase n=1 Tax=Trichinella murrelli TaxID=144512 RepID=A0A0V0UAY6_9BILA|nr:Snake venom 5'-nucleotidase [Trichinella murrelli]